MTEPAYDLVIRGGTRRDRERRVRGRRRHLRRDDRRDRPRAAGRRGARSTRAASWCCPAASTATPISSSSRPRASMNADTFESATVSAAFGGTTTRDLVRRPACRHEAAAGASRTITRCAKKGAVIDYAFHMIVADPTKETLEKDLPALIKQGHGSIKIFMTYDRLKIDDEQLLDILLAARDGGAMRLRPCREPRHDLLDGEAAAGARLHRAEISRHQPSARLRSGGLQPADRAWRR